MANSLYDIKKNTQVVKNNLLTISMVLLIFLGCFLIVNSYSSNSVTIDERSHIGAGFQWIKDGKFTYEPKHPPLARVFSAIGPYLEGASRFKASDMFLDGQNAIFGFGDYQTNLRLSRLGILPFFILAALAVFYFGRFISGKLGGFVALILFILCPPILAHSGVSTTDMACCAMIIAFEFCLVLWLNSPSLMKLSAVGFFLSLALLTKMTAVMYIPILSITTLAIYFIFNKNKKKLISKLISFGSFKGIVCFALVVFVTLWAGYRFSFQTISSVDSYFGEFVEKESQKHFYVPHGLKYIADKVSVPMPEFFAGIHQTIKHVEVGHPSYLLGMVGENGWWYFYIVTFLTKTPLPFLILFLLSLLVCVKRIIKKEYSYWYEWIAPACVIVSMVSMFFSTINIGIRHILFVYPFVAISAGWGVAHILKSIQKKTVFSSVLVVLILLNLIDTIRVQSNYLSYFNQLSLLTSDPILVDSDRNWGQEMYKVKDYVTKNKLDKINIALLGYFKEDAGIYNLQNATNLERNKKTTGWIAISSYFYYVNGGYTWLHDYKPVDIIGNSVYIFHIDKL